MNLRVVLLTLCVFATALPAAAGGVITLTRPSVNDYGDPSRPQFENGKVTITTTGGFLLTWETTKDFFAGHEPKNELLEVCHEDGTPLSLEAGEDIWDPTLERGELIGSIMVPPEGETNAHWPEDAFSRRTFQFHLVDGCWRRDEEPLWPSKPGWIGHTYGHDELEGVLFYEKVTKEKNGRPVATDLFARQGGREISIFKSARWPAAQREDGTSLVEGPRPFKIGTTYYISFSAGDYFSPKYGVHLLKSQSITGPYKPVLTKNKSDLKDFSYLIENEIALTWGAGRAAFFEYQNQWWMIVHGIPAPFDGPDGLRQLFMIRVDPTQLN